MIRKIGVTGGDVKTLFANVKKDPTYLLAEVAVVDTFKLANINRKSLETLLHKFFANARLDLKLKDRFGGQVQPREWFVVPFAPIDPAIERIKEGTIGNYCYDKELASIKPA